MKKKLLFALYALSAATATPFFVSCEDNDNSVEEVTEEISDEVDDATTD